MRFGCHPSNKAAFFFKNLSVLFLLLVGSSYTFAAEVSCNDILLDSKNRAVFQDLARLRVAMHGAHDRASSLLLKKEFEGKIKALAQTLNMDAKDLGLINFTEVLKKQKTSEPSIPEYVFPTNVQSILQQIKNDPDFPIIKNWVRLLLANEKEEDILKESHLVLSNSTKTEENNYNAVTNVSAVKAAFILIGALVGSWEDFSNALKKISDFSQTSESHLDRFPHWYVFFAYVIEYDDVYLTKLWVLNGGDPNREDGLFDPQSGMQYSLFEEAILKKKWNVVNALTEMSADPINERTKQRGNGETTILGPLFIKETYENLEFLKKLKELGADFISPRSNVRVRNYLLTFGSIVTNAPWSSTYFIPGMYRFTKDIKKHLENKPKLPTEVLKFLLSELYSHKHTIDYAIFFKDLCISILLNALESENIEDIEFIFEGGLDEKSPFYIFDDFYYNKKNIFSLALKLGKLNLAQKLLDKNYTYFGVSKNPIYRAFSSHLIKTKYLLRKPAEPKLE